MQEFKNEIDYWLNVLPNVNKLINLNHLINCHVVFISQDVTTDHKGKSDFKSLKKLIKNIIINKVFIKIILLL